MTLILALVGESDAVLAADSETNSNDKAGMYTSSMTKLRLVNDSKWIAGVAHSPIGFDIQDCIEASGETFNKDIHIGVHQYAKRMRDLYLEHEYTQDTSILIAGNTRNGVAVYGWNLTGAKEPAFDGARQIHNPTAVGAHYHGAMYFSSRFHSPKVTTIQRISLAHFCVSEVCKQDPRVDFPVEIGLVRRNHPPQLLNAQDLGKVQEQSDKIGPEIERMILQSNPDIPALHIGA